MKVIHDSEGRRLCQRRLTACRKLIGPGQWDVSVAEHLQPGESYREAAVQGLKEELGIVLLAGDVVVGPLAPSFRRSMVVRQSAIPMHIG